jgi:DNA processing protein
MAGGSPTMAYVPFGLDAPVYPPENQALARRIVDCGGALISACEPQAVAVADAFVARDRLQAEHADAVVLVSSERDGGAMHAVRYARELGKPAFAVTPPPDAPEGESHWGGNVDALASGALALPRNADEALRVLYDRLPHVFARYTR